MSRPPSVSHSCVSVLARRGLGPCWAPTAMGSGQVLGLWSPGPAGSWWVPGVVLCQGRPRLCPASPCPACGQEPGPGHILAWSGGHLLCGVGVLGSPTLGAPHLSQPRLPQWPGAGPGGCGRGMVQAGGLRLPWASCLEDGRADLSSVSVSWFLRQAGGETLGQNQVVTASLVGGVFVPSPVCVNLAGPGIGSQGL